MNFFLEADDKNENSFLYGFLNNFVSDGENPFLFILSVFFTIFFLKIILLIYLSWLEAGFISRFKERLSNILFENFLNRKVYKILRKNSSEYLRNFTTEIDFTTIFYFSMLKLILDFILIITLFVFLTFFDLLASISTIILLTILSSVYYLLVKNYIRLWGKKRLYNQKKKIQFVNESFSAIKYIKILSRENYFFNKFKIQNFSLFKINFKINFFNTLPKFIFEFFLFVSILLILIILFYNNYEYKEIIKIVSVYIVVSFRLIPSANRILTSIQNLKYTHPAFEKIFNETKTKTILKDINIKKFSFSRDIEINIKKFNYNLKSKFFLKNIKFKINKKEKIGIIGPSGSGKSTLIDVICGFVKINNGDVFVDNKSIYNNLNGWQKKIGYIPQKIVILDDSLRNNILFGLNNKDYNDSKLKNILKKVNLENFYKQLPNGLSEKISEEGSNISGGEIQRIGIARALINNPEIIVLDEGTSALDTFTENKILKEINSLKKTIIFVSHRINSLRYCDKIYHIEKGKMKDFGTFKNFFNKYAVR
jgi:ABC-type multidrug transport system fused ATPase/permease subunit